MSNVLLWFPRVALTDCNVEGKIILGTLFHICKKRDFWMNLQKMKNRIPRLVGAVNYRNQIHLTTKFFSML